MSSHQEPNRQPVSRETLANAKDVLPELVDAAVDWVDNEKVLSDPGGGMRARNRAGANIRQAFEDIKRLLTTIFTDRPRK